MLDYYLSHQKKIIIKDSLKNGYCRIDESRHEEKHGGADAVPEIAYTKTKTTSDGHSSSHGS